MNLVNRAIMSETPNPDLETRLTQLESRVEKLESTLADPARAKTQNRAAIKPVVKPALTKAQQAADAAMIKEAARRAANIESAKRKIFNQVATGRAA